MSTRFSLLRVLGVPVWLMPFLLLPVLFSIWSIVLVVSVARLRTDVERDVGLTGQLGQLVRMAREFQTVLAANPPGAPLPAAWISVRTRFSDAARILLANDATDPIRVPVTQAIDLTAAFEVQLIDPGSTGSGAGDRSSRILKINNDVIDRLTVATATIRGRLAELSAQLGWKWTQLNFLAAASVVLALAVGLLLVFSERVSADRRKVVAELQARLDEIKQLRGILPMCSYCKRIRDDRQYWQQLETYLAEHSGAYVSHGICPSCYETIVDGAGVDEVGSIRSTSL